MHADGDWQAVEGVLSKDKATISEYLPDLEVKSRHYKDGVGSLLTRKLNVS